MRRPGLWATCACVAAVLAVLSGAAAGWACVPMANVEVTPRFVAASEDVTVSGIRFISFEPVSIRLNTLDGPVLATVPMGPTANTIFKTTVTIPAGTPPGPAVLIITQDSTPGYIAVGWGIPARTVVTVTAPDGSAPPVAPPEVLDRPDGLARAAAGTGPLVLAALAVGAGALLVAGSAAAIVGRRTGRSRDLYSGDAW